MSILIKEKIYSNEINFDYLYLLVIESYLDFTNKTIKTTYDRLSEPIELA